MYTQRYMTRYVISYIDAYTNKGYLRICIHIAMHEYKQ